MVHTWLHEVSTNQNIYADLQLQHFYRYIIILTVTVKILKAG